jgi:hypothetical protein
MISALAVKPDPPAPDVAAEYAAAETAWREINAKLRELRIELERRRLAQHFAQYAEVAERSKDLAATVADLITATQRSPLKAASDIEALEFDFAVLRPQYTAAHEAYTVARNAMATQLAMSFRERHLDATKQIVAAIDALSVALQVERDIRAEFSAVSPEPTSIHLPDVSRDLSQMDLSRWDSVASVWARRVRNFGVSA